MMDQLVKCPGVTISVSFYRPGKDAMWAPEDSDWSVFHEAHANRFSFRINLDSKSIDLDQLYIPPIRGEAETTPLK